MNVGFMVSALLLGQATMIMLLAYELKGSHMHALFVDRRLVYGILLTLLLVQLALILKQSFQSRLQSIRISLIFAAILLSMIDLVVFKSNVIWITTAFFLVIGVEEIMGRWLFYCSRPRTIFISGS